MARAGRDLPFLLGRQVLAGEARERVGLIVADVSDGRGGIDWLQASEGQLMPRAVALLPVARRGPALVLHGGPAVREPQLRLGVAAGSDEFEPLAIRHKRTC